MMGLGQSQARAGSWRGMGTLVCGCTELLGSALLSLHRCSRGGRVQARRWFGCRGLIRCPKEAGELGAAQEQLRSVEVMKCCKAQMKAASSKMTLMGKNAWVQAS